MYSWFHRICNSTWHIFFFVLYDSSYSQKDFSHLVYLTSCILRLLDRVSQPTLRFISLLPLFDIDKSMVFIKFAILRLHTSANFVPTREFMPLLIPSGSYQHTNNQILWLASSFQYQLGKQFQFDRIDSSWARYSYRFAAFARQISQPKFKGGSRIFET